MKGDLLCWGCGGSHFYVKPWSGTGWYICCDQCQRLYQLLADGEVKEVVYAN